MNFYSLWPGLVLLITAVFILSVFGALLLLAYKVPSSQRSRNFPFTRRCLGFCVLCFGVALVAVHFAPYDPEVGLVISGFALAICWIAWIFASRGVFELLMERGFMMERVNRS